MESNSQKNILFTVAYFNAMEYFPTVFEVWKSLINKDGKKQKVALCDVQTGVEKLKKEARISQKRGFLFLKNESAQPRERIVKQKISMAKTKLLLKWIKRLEWLPYLRGVFVTGTLAMKNSKKESDWDVLVVMARNRIWVGRLFLTLFLQFFRKRRHGRRLKNRFCLNHFIVEQGLVFEERNEFSANEIIFSMPVVGKKIHKKFLGLNEYWVQFFKPNFEKQKLPGYFSRETSEKKLFVRRSSEYFLELIWVGGALNRISKNLMVKRINRNPKTYLDTADIRYGDMSLVFLPRPQREKILKEAEKKLTFSSE